MLGPLLREARQAAIAPEDYFAAAPAEESWSKPAGRMAFWAMLAGAVEVALSFAAKQRSPGDFLVDLLTLAVFPLLTLALVFASTLFLHAVWRALGGKAPLKASWRAASGLAFTMPADILLGPFGLLALAPHFWRYALLAYAGQGVHGLKKKRAWGFAAALAVAHVLALALS
ncbi:MAG: hypothetical protein HYZ75_16160 [Elusimicrobia bacterium]|nr:hypothetical protein [Elusimicrobiota bacterium]